MAATSATRYYLSLDTYKGAGDVTLGSRAISTLAAGASSPGNPSFTIQSTTAVGSYRVLACADDTAKVLESDEDNNCAASTTAVSLTRPDLVPGAVSSPAGSLAPGGGFTVSATVINQGGYSSGVSTTRYYLSIDDTKSAGDLVLTGTRLVPALTPSAASTSNASVTIPASAALATYYVVACADDLKKVIELQEGNNCRASGIQLVVSRPDLFTSAVSNPPAQTAPGRSFSLADTVENEGQVGATASTTRYYLSTDAVKDAGDVLLSGTRSVAVLSPAAASTGNRSVRVPDTTPTGTYRALACADDLLKVMEKNESNNCAVSSGTVQVLYPDLVQTAVSSPPAASGVGATFSVTDTVAAAAAIATTATSTRYYLSSDTIKDASDVVLTGTRGVPAIPAGGLNTGTRVVTIPPIASGTYYLLACADDTKLAIESDELNNCLAAAVTITIGP